MHNYPFSQYYLPHELIKLTGGKKVSNNSAITDATNQRFSFQ